VTAQHILSRWERVAPVLQGANLCYGGGGVKALTYWLALLHVARGHTSAPELMTSMRVSLSLASGMLRLMDKQGLAQLVRKEARHNRPRTIWGPTAQLFELLGLAPMPPQTTEVRA
jgi:hypothetical protein